MMTFKKWLARFSGENSPRGDLARDILADIDFPDTANVERMQDYFSARGLTGSDPESAALSSAFQQWLEAF